MKKYVKWIIVVIIPIITGASIYPTKSVVNATSSTEPLVNSASYTKALMSYEWYKDEELTDPTGTVCAINVECNRLSFIFPMYVFQSSLAMGLYPYEYGYYPGLPLVIIYSNIPNY